MLPLAHGASAIDRALEEAEEGRVERVAIGGQPARLVAALAPGEQALVVLPAVPLNGLDLLQAELTVALGKLEADPGKGREMTNDPAWRDK